MMVSVDGFSDPEQSAILERLVRYCVEYYFSDKDTDSFEIDVVADLSLYDIGRFADCSVQCSTRKAPKSFLIRLVPSGVSFMEQMRLVAHEMVHVKQFHENEFDVKLEGSVFVWKKKTVYASDIKPWCEPWELEARGMEKALVELFVENYNLRSSSWYQQCV